MTLARRAVAEFVATAFLLAIVVGSGIMGERLAGGNDAIALLANSIATGCGLVVLITTFGPVSGAHMNPLVTLALAGTGRHAWSDVPFYVLAQCAGAIAGVWIAHAMFALPIVELSSKARAGSAQMFAESVATFGLLTVIFGGLRHRAKSIPVSVGCYIAAAYWFTASTSFANPAVTLARSLTDSFSGIRFADVGGFIVAQFAGATVAIAADALFFRVSAPVKPR